MDGTEVIRDGAEMVRRMRPRRMPGAFAFVSMTAQAAAPLLAGARAVFVEEEGVSLLLPVAETAPEAMAQITLQVHSALDGVGLTAAVSGALAAEGIPCNMIAATHHDHVFVPVAMAERAVAVLEARAGQTDGDD
ncbi:MAG: ACT domain-containing protein [Roseicyclus sp.]